MTTKIEHVARALCWKNGMDPDKTLGGDGVNFLWHEYVPQARAAIEAMRALSPSMMGLDAAGFGWQAMIDAALKEE